MSEEAELLTALIRHGCVNDGRTVVGERPNADLLASVLDGCGADIEVVDSAPERRNVVARIPGTDAQAPTLLLLAHTDVVPVAPERWTQDPFGGEVIDGFVWGRGALDMLGYAATMALALRDWAKAGRRHRGDVVFAAVADEEMLGTFGTEWLLEHHRDLLDADWVLTEGGGVTLWSPEGPGVMASVADKGVWRLRVTVQGEARHVALAGGADHALAVAAEACARITGASTEVQITEPWKWFVQDAWQEPARSLLVDPERITSVLPQLPADAARLVESGTRMTFVVTAIETNGSWNTVPSQAQLDVQARSLPGQSATDVVDVVREALGSVGAAATIEIIGGSPATTTPPGTGLWKVAERAVQRQRPGAGLRPSINPGATDARFLRSRGAASYGVGLLSEEFPADELSRMMHGDDERIDLASLTMMRTLWSDVLELHAEVDSR